MGGDGDDRQFHDLRRDGGSGAWLSPDGGELAARRQGVGESRVFELTVHPNEPRTVRRRQ